MLRELRSPFPDMNAAPTGVFVARSTYLDRWVQIGVASGKVINVAFPVDRPEPVVDENHPVLDRVLAYLDDGERDTFEDVDIGLTVPTEYRRIYDTVRTIPYGTEWSSEHVAEQTAILEPGEESLQTVREALGANPVPVIVPDHRVTGLPGSLASQLRGALRDREGL